MVTEGSNGEERANKVGENVKFRVAVWVEVVIDPSGRVTVSGSVVGTISRSADMSLSDM